MPALKALYDEDFVAWSEQQAEALRCRGGSNQPLDWENLAEEIESLGRSERRELRSRISTIIEHLVKLAQSPAADPRRDWRHTISRERMDIERLLEDSPSLARDVADIAGKETRRSAKAALDDLERRGELPQPLQPAQARPAYLESVGYTPEQILGDWFPPEPQTPA